MGYLILGAGAVGSTIGALLFERGQAVTLVARGRHLQAMRSYGLLLQQPHREVTFRIPAVASPSETEVKSSDVVLLTTKSQDSVAALTSLAAVAPPDIAVVCAQNGVNNERVALRHFRRVYGMSVSLPCTHLDPGVVRAEGAPRPGILDVGRYPHGSGPTATTIARHLADAGFSARAHDPIMSWKYRKLLGNLGNALNALAGDAGRTSGFLELAQSEAEAVFAAASVDVVPEDVAQRREADADCAIHPVAGQDRPGGSQWQSLARKTGSVETDYINGEIVLLGRLHGVPTPVNSMIQRSLAEMVRQQAPPGSVSLAQLMSTQN